MCENVGFLSHEKYVMLDIWRIKTLLTLDL